VVLEVLGEMEELGLLVALVNLEATVKKIRIKIIIIHNYYSFVQGGNGGSGGIVGLPGYCWIKFNGYSSPNISCSFNNNFNSVVTATSVSNCATKCFNPCKNFVFISNTSQCQLYNSSSISQSDANYNVANTNCGIMGNH
jgi:hypothetical protein